MSDDLANNWGTNLCLPERYNTTSFAPMLPKSRSRLGLGGGTTHTSLPVLVAAESNKFTFGTVAACGSQANSWAINDATQNNASLCLFAAGSYVAGDGTSLQQYSTSEFDIGAQLCHIMPPKEVLTSAGRANTIPLPYHIPGVLTPDQLTHYEDECLQKVHIQLCWAKMQSKPYKALLLELILAGNGATLSHRALISIGKLAAYHQLRVIVDEIMTGGRTGSMIYLLSKPVSFQAVVTHVTFGKWTQMGIVIMSKTWAERRKIMYPFTKRSASTYLCEDDAVRQWKCMKEFLQQTSVRRAKILRKLKLTEEHVWGEGLLLFGPRKIETTRGLKCRYLPMIHENTPIDNVGSTLVMPGHRFRVVVNQQIMDATRQWISDVPQFVLDPEGSSPVEQERMNAERSSDFAFIDKLIKGSSDSDEKTAREWKDQYMPEGNRHKGETTLAKLRDAGYMVQTKKGAKRMRCWKLKEGFIAPWKSEHFAVVVM
jgi:hypothetical protein